MSKKANPYVLVIKIILIFISLLCLRNSIFQFIVAIYLFSTGYNKKSYKLAKITLFCTLFNTFCGKLTILCNILLFIDTFLWITNDITIHDLIDYCDYMVKNKRIKTIIIKVLYFERYFKKNNRVIKKYNVNCNKPKLKVKVKQYRQAFVMTKKDLEKVCLEFEKRLYYNNYKNKKIYKVCTKDKIAILLLLILFIIVITIGGSTYALFD